MFRLCVFKFCYVILFFFLICYFIWVILLLFKYIMLRGDKTCLTHRPFYPYFFCGESQCFRSTTSNMFSQLYFLGFLQLFGNKGRLSAGLSLPIFNISLTPSFCNLLRDGPERDEHAYLSPLIMFVFIYVNYFNIVYSFTFGINSFKLFHNLSNIFTIHFVW